MISSKCAKCELERVKCICANGFSVEKKIVFVDFKKGGKSEVRKLQK